MFIFFLFTFYFCIGLSQIILLTQSNFAGTLRITSPGTYRLEEDIVFNPNPATDLTNANSNNAWLPTNSALYPNADGQPFFVGYFAAITIETSNVIIDLNGYSIEMHDQFCMQQRFFSIIDVNAPFEIGTGPANFGNVIPISNLVIMNGTLGRSSHQGIHLNSVRNVQINNLLIKDFEVAGITINNFENVQINNVEIGPSATTVYNNVYYSNSRFNLYKLRKMMARNSSATMNFADRPNPVSVSTIYNSLVESMNLFFQYQFVDGAPNVNTIPLTRLNTQLVQSVHLFGNQPSNLPDGATLYGILLNSYGPAVFGFGDSPGNSSNITINNVFIHDLNNQIREILGYYTTNSSRTPIRGAFADVVAMNMICINESSNNVLSNCTYRGNYISDAQLAIASLGKSSNDETGLSFINNNFSQWMSNNQKLHSGLLKCGGDVMTHSIKGLIGIRMDNIINATLNNINMDNFNNQSPLGSNLCGAYETDANPNAIFGTIDGYMGTHVRGIITYNSDDILLNQIEMQNFQSNYGDTIGIDIRKDSFVILGDNVISINNLNAGSNLNSNQALFLSQNDLPNHFSRMCGILYDNTSAVGLMGSSDIANHITITDLRGYAPCENQFENFATSVTINSI